MEIGGGMEKAIGVNIDHVIESGIDGRVIESEIVHALRCDRSNVHHHGDRILHPYNNQEWENEHAL